MSCADAVTIDVSTNGNSVFVHYHGFHTTEESIAIMSIWYEIGDQIGNYNNTFDCLFTTFYFFSVL